MNPAHHHVHIQEEGDIALHCLHWTTGSKKSQNDISPVVLLHGGGANAHWWDHLARPLCSTREVYALDFRGHGDSDHPSERRVGAFNDDLEALLENLGRRDVILVGHSLGAAVALDHASRFEQTRGIVLIDLARGSGTKPRRRARLALSARRTYRSREEAVERFRFLPETSHPTESLRRHIAEQSVQRDSDGRYGYKFDPGWFGLPSRPRPDLAQIRCPTLLVRGAESELLSPEAAREFISHLEKGQLVEIPDAGHHVLIDQPERLHGMLEAFFDRIDARSRSSRIEEGA